MGWRDGIIVHTGDSFSLEFCCYLQDRENPLLLQPATGKSVSVRATAFLTGMV